MLLTFADDQELQFYDEFSFSTGIQGCFNILMMTKIYSFLTNSVFKRNIGVKDSGKLIPGHGGLMDRFDGYFLVIPFAFFFIK